MTFQNVVIEFEKTDSFCVYSLPGSTDHNLVYSDNKSAILDPSNEESYVVLSSFDKADSVNEYIIADHQVENGKFGFRPHGRCPLESTEYDRYEWKLNKALTAIDKNEFDKVVLSRLVVSENGIQDIYEYYVNLKSQYPKAFVFLYHTPERGCWCGASPEVLIKGDENYLMTMALAGTQLNRGIPLDIVKWTEKEHLEHGLIEVFVEERLDAQEVNYKKSLVQTVEAGNVLHLCSKYYISSDVDIESLVDELHPGPAICGFPQEPSMDFIRNHEGHDRMDYCGYIGLRNMVGHTEYYANLRCMRLYQDRNVLFVGGGITKQSNPSDEWEETTIKSQTLLSTISNPLVK